MALIQGADIVLELEVIPGNWFDLTCLTTSAEWQWGAPEALGPLTECEGGTLRVSVHDPEREFDPDNPDSSLLPYLKVGLGMRVTVDGSPAWTGALQTWGWDRASTIADLNGLDPIGQLSVRALPDAGTLMAAPATTGAQAQWVLDQVEWPVGKRYIPAGASGILRGHHDVEGSALDLLHQIRFAELGRLFPLRDGGIAWYDRDGPAPPASSAVINCGGVGLTDMWKALGLGRVRNHVVVVKTGFYGVFGPVMPADLYRSVTATQEFLFMMQSGSAAGSFPWDPWARTIMDVLADPPPLTVLGTILPVGGQVADILCSEFGARWTVAVDGEADSVVQVFGQRVSLAPGTIEVEAVTEDALPYIPVLHRWADTGSGWLRSQNAAYSTARAGSGVTVDPLGFGEGRVLVGQVVESPGFKVEEGFVSFDTSSIPAGATIVSATFGAATSAHGTGLPFVNFDIEVRSGYGWRPTLDAADWRPGAGIAAGYPLRATLNTSRGYGFFEWDDAGSGLAGAVVKGGTTQLLIVSSRVVAGTTPAAGQYEELQLGFMRLRVHYTLP